MYGMKNTLYEGYMGPRMTPAVAKRRLKNVIENELTEKQRRVIIGYYLENQNIVQLAALYGVNKSTIWRTLKRGETRMRRCLKY